MVPAGHVARIGWVEMTGAGEPAQHASAHLLLHRGEVFRCQRGGLGEVDLPVLADGKHPVDHAAVEVHMGIQRAAEALHKAHRAQPPARAAAALTQPRLDDAQQDVQHRAERLGIALQEVAQALRDRQHPLTHRQRREDLVDQMGSRLGHAPRVAGRAYPAAFARKRDQKIVSALLAPSAGEAVGQNAAFEVAAKLPLHVPRHAVPIGVPVAGERQVGLADGPAPRGTGVCARGGAGGRRCSGPGSRPRGPCDRCIRLVTAG